MDLISLKKRRRQRASVLVLVLIVISSMTILAFGLGYRTRIEMKLAGNYAAGTKAYYLALGGIERIKVALSGEELSAEMISRICRFNGTAKEEQLFEQLKSGWSEETALLAYCLRDEQGYFNVNKSDSASWENLACVEREHRAGILDWVDSDDDTSSQGAETDFYERLEPPYVCKNGDCVALRELLFVKAITRGHYLGEVLSREPFVEQMFEGQEFQFVPEQGGDLADLGLVNVFTVYGNGKVNVNTASGTILKALPGLDEQAIDAILTYRGGLDGQAGTDDDIFIKSAETFANIEGLSGLQAELLRQYSCFDSEYFRIFSYARLSNTYECCLMATVGMADGKPVVICLERLR